MRARALDAFLAEQIADAKEQGLLFSLHLKATMMKVSDPIIFGHAVRAFFAGVFTEHHDALEKLGASPNNGLGAILSALDDLPQRRGRRDPRRDRQDLRDRRPTSSMVDSDRGITNLHVPSDVIIDASMPAMIRASGQLWNANGDTAGHQGGHPGPLVRGAVRGDDRLLPRARRVRPDDDGHDAERRPDGAEGRGVRQPRQDVRDRGQRARARGRQRGRHADRARGRGGRHLARVPDQGRAGPRLGAARGRARAGDRRAGRVLARPHAGARRRAAQEGRGLPRRGGHGRAADRDPAGRARRRGSRSSARSAARTRSRSPATCCATT